jgi:hypothetical protein
VEPGRLHALQDRGCVRLAPAECCYLGLVRTGGSWCGDGWGSCRQGAHDAVMDGARDLIWLWASGRENTRSLNDGEADGMEAFFN